MKRIILLVITVCIISAATNAQTDFSGDWTLKEKEHVTGPEYSNALPRQMTIIQTTDSLIIESVSTGADGADTKSRQSLAMNGKQFTTVSATSKRKYVRGLAWSADKKTITITTAFYIPDNESEVDFTRVETWSLTNGQLTIDRKSLETRSETWEVKGVFEKQ